MEAVFLPDENKLSKIQQAMLCGVTCMNAGTYVCAYVKMQASHSEVCMQEHLNVCASPTGLLDLAPPSALLSDCFPSFLATILPT